MKPEFLHRKTFQRLAGFPPLEHRRKLERGVCFSVCNLRVGTLDAKKRTARLFYKE